MAETSFSPTWLFDAGGNSQLTQSQDEHDALIEAGWKDTPAAFGIETHPQQTMQPVMGQVGSAGGAAISPSALAQLEQHIHELVEMVGTLQQQHRTEMAAVQERLAALEATPSQDPEQSGSSRRRS